MASNGRELHVRGVPRTIQAPNGPLEVWLVKLTRADQRRAARAAGAAKAVVAAEARDPQSDLYLAFAHEVDRYDRDTLVAYAVREDLAKAGRSIQARMEIGSGDDDDDDQETSWSKDGYLTGLFDAWNNGLRDRYAVDPADPEAARVFAELKRFNTEMDEALEAEKQALQERWAKVNIERLRQRALEVLLEEEANAAWSDEYELSKIWLCTRKASDHSERVFVTREEVDLNDEVDDAGRREPTSVVAQLLAAYDEIELGVEEAKKGPANPASSPPSESPEAPEPDLSSGQPVSVP